ncbi:bifunctional copper resistance protein CopD/cytochrome c oxidase assembly protein [Aeromicrobium sp. Sec7.5]|uniref:bifunctional copper resistance protein CopD/cytochrome c oxidase assembly protein n=1 Tax=Aeromicrobium sp. Sec7.5 TaxID=3121276 RepID=UPI002FE42E38
MIWAGSAPREPVPGLPDPGVLVGWLVPVATGMADLAGIATIGFLILAAVLLPSSGRDVQGLAVDAVRIARRSAWVWVVATVVTFIVTAADVFAVTLGGLRVDLLVALLRDSEVGRGIALQAMGALVLAVTLRWVVGVRALAGWSLFAVATLLPSALTGHAASGGSHSLASVSLYLHLAAVAVWVGALCALAWVASRRSRRLEPAVRRYSHVAMACFAVVGISGVISAMVRATDLDQLISSAYGQLVLLKVIALAVLGSFGWWQRRRILRSGGGFARIAGVEVLLMMATVGVAVALSRTPPPAGSVLLTPSEDLLGGPMPPAPTFTNVAFGVYPSGVGLAVVGFGSVLYLIGVLALRRRGEDWPLRRSAAWTAGMLVVAWATSGGLGTYTHVLFSAHLTSQALLVMVAAPLLVLGAPGALAASSLPGPRQAGEISPRDLLLAVCSSRAVRRLGHPLCGLVLLSATALILYGSPLFAALMSSLLGHLGMELWILTVGLVLHTGLFGSSLLPELDLRLRSLTARVAMLLAAGFGLALLASDTSVGQDYWVGLARPYATDLAADQERGAVIYLAIVVPVLTVISIDLLRRFRKRHLPSAVPHTKEAR